MYYEDYFVEILCGGHVQWCYSKRFREWSLRLLYYKACKRQQVKSQVLQRKPPFYCSGFVSRERGIHRNFQRRLARN